MRRKTAPLPPRRIYPDEPRRCDTGIVAAEMGECCHCNAAQGEACLAPIITTGD